MFFFLLLLKFSIRKTKKKRKKHKPYYKCNIIIIHTRMDRKTQQSERKEPDKSSTELLMPYVHIRISFGYILLCVTDSWCTGHGFLFVEMCVQSKTNFLVETKLGETEEIARIYLKPLLVYTVCSFWATHSIFFTIQSLCDLSALNSMSWHSLLALVVEKNETTRWFYFSLSVCMCWLYFILFYRANQLCI